MTTVRAEHIAQCQGKYLTTVVPDDPLVPEDRQGKICSAVLEKVLDDQLIRDDRQGGTYRTVLGKVFDDRWVPDDPLLSDDR